MRVRNTKYIKFISSALIVSTLVAIFCLCFFPRYHSKVCNNIECYSMEEYRKFGVGFNRYGKIAATYLPKYEDVFEDSKNIEFLYSSGGAYDKTVDVIVNVEYEESAYLSKKEDMLQAGENFGEDMHIGELGSRHHRLMKKFRKLNGEYVYYIVSCCDKDMCITYSVMFDPEEYMDFSSLSIHSHPYYNCFRNIHVKCMNYET